MNLLAPILLLAGMTAAAACFAEDANFCESMCSSQQRACRLDARSHADERQLTQSELAQRNPLARVAEGEVAGQGARALATSGATNRRLDRSDACDKSFQQCRRSCDVSPAKPSSAPRATGKAP